MPETNTMFSRRRPELGQEALHGGQHGVVAAAGAPADLLVGGEVLAGLGLVGRRRTPARPGNGRSGGSVAHQCVTARLLRVSIGRRSTPSAWRDQVGDRVGELGGLERQAADLVVADDVDQVLARAAAARAGRGSSRAPAPRRSAQDVAEVLRERVEVAQVHLGDVVAGLADAAARRADRAVRRAPARAPAPWPRRSGSSTSSGGSDSAIRSTLAWRVRTMKSWLAGS